ncbi:MAG: hypothetical protein ABIT07_04570 [Ferruginibacter sp.]
MKKIIISIMFSILTLLSLAQKKGMFIRVVNESGKISFRGHLDHYSDSSITLIIKNDTSEIPVSKITALKLKHTIGHSAWIGAAIGGVGLGIVGAASGEPKANDNTLGGAFHDLFTYTAAEGFIGGMIAGGATGALIGILVRSLGKKITFQVNKSQQSWLDIKDQLKPYLPEQNN